jgi:NADPH:quinone reductase-like Zn-dependent oxidoreductase
MKALVLSAYGDVEQLALVDTPEPGIGLGDVKIRVHAASINPLDWKLLSGYGRGTALELRFPAILGRDASGDVLEVGHGVVDLRSGDRVLGFASRTFAERVVAPESAWAKAPRGLDAVQAAALPMVALTGAQLADTVQPRPGLGVLVTGAVGGVGRVAVFVAKAAGATVWAGVRAAQKTAAEALGANHVVAIDDEAEIAALPALDALCDTVGGVTVAKLLPRLKEGGVLSSTLGEPPGAKERGLRVTAIRTQPDSGRLRELAEAAAAGRLVIPVRRTFPLEQAADAFRLARQGGVGKVLLLPK